MLEGKKLSTFRVVDLRQELEKRGLEKTGVKAVLIERLQKVLNAVYVGNKNGRKRVSQATLRAFALLTLDILYIQALEEEDPLAQDEEELDEEEENQNGSATEEEDANDLNDEDAEEEEEDVEPLDEEELPADEENEPVLSDSAQDETCNY